MDKTKPFKNQPPQTSNVENPPTASFRFAVFFLAPSSEVLLFTSSVSSLSLWGAA